MLSIDIYRCYGTNCQSILQGICSPLTFEDRTDMLYRKVGN